jgi:ribosomal protein S18 acetylase RimI-like enzyme
VSLAVRVATAGDAGAIAQVHVRSWQAAYRGQLPDHVLDTLSVEQRQSMWRSLLVASSTGEQHIVVATVDEAVVGFVHGGRSRDADAGPHTAEVSSIYLAAEAWGLGAGRQLMASIVMWMAGAGYAEATLWVLASNERARRFYEAAAWWVDGTEKTETVAGVDVTELRYRRDLRPS